MIVEQIYTGCLAQGAYYIESNGEVAIIDPLREVQPYIDKASAADATIKYIFETHFHADFVSGHVTLSQVTGAPIIYGPSATTAFESIIATDDQEFSLGEVTIKVLHTPGHTLESTTYLLLDKEGAPYAIFSGDTLFLGDVGRPDLAQKGSDMTSQDLAGMLYDSLRSKIMVLPDDVIVYPAHGAGSACGKNMMKETVDTLGNQKKMNYALRANMTKEEFISEVTEGLLPPPDYFPLNVRMNKEGYTDIKEVIKKGLNAYSPKEFELIANEADAIILDVRHHDDFAQGHVPRSIFIGLDGSFAPWVGELIKDVQQPLMLVCDEDRLEEAITRLSRVGFDHILGYLEGGVHSWDEMGYELDHVTNVMASTLADTTLPVIDVRKQSEYEAEHLPVAENIPLSHLVNELARVPKNQDILMHCAGGCLLYTSPSPRD